MHSRLEKTASAIYFIKVCYICLFYEPQIKFHNTLTRSKFFQKPRQFKPLLCMYNQYQSTLYLTKRVVQAV